MKHSPNIEATPRSQRCIQHSFATKVKYAILNCYHKKIPHIWRRWGTPQSFCLAFTDELEKQLFKKLLKWANKKCKNFNIYNVLFF